MAKGKGKTFTVTCEPSGAKPKLASRDGEERTAVRNYHLEADSAEDARSLVEERERLLALQEDAKPWKVAKVKAD